MCSPASPCGGVLFEDESVVAMGPLGKAYVIRTIYSCLNAHHFVRDFPMPVYMEDQ